MEIIVQNDIITLAIQPVQPEIYYKNYFQYSDIAQKASTFSNTHRRCEWLNTHDLLHQLIQPPVTYTYNSEGKPELLGTSLFLSITHSPHYSAVALSKTHRLGVDMEEDDADFIKASRKFLHATEKIWAAGQNDLLRAIWCAKESIYKMQINASPNFSIDYEIHPFTLNPTGTITATITTPIKRQINIYYCHRQNYFITWCFQNGIYK